MVKENYTCVLILGTRGWEDPGFQASLRKNEGQARKGMEKGEGMVRGGWAKCKEEEGKKDADERGKEGEGRAEQGRAGQGKEG